jgi:ABC-2 type transport system permease protein
MGYGSSLARSLIEERMNKVMEVLLSSVTPFQIMAGKMLGLGAAGLTQFGIWSIAAVGLSAGRGRAAGGEAPFSVEPWMLGLFLLYFALGFFLFAALFCVVGSMCTSEQEAQNTQMPVVMLLVIPMAIALMIVQQPSSPAAVALSHVPFFAPIIMFMRISVLTPPAWEIALNVLVVLATIVASVWAAGRIFRIGILMTGKKATIPEVARWLRA